MRKLLVSVTFVLVALPAFAASFPDTGSSPFDAEIGQLKQSGTVSGYADGTYRPNNLVNRAEFVKMIMLEDGHEGHAMEMSPCFTDFHDGEPEWYYGYACTAKNEGYVQGYPDGSFGGARTINLAEALKIIMSGRHMYPDLGENARQWYDPYFAEADKLGVFAALPRVPGHVVTRGEMAYLLTHVVKQRPPKPEGTTASRFLLHETGYSCSKEIQGEWKEADVGQLGDPGWYFYPSDQEEFKMFCREEYVIEYRAVIDILGRDDVASVMVKYDNAHAWVRALGHVYIDDKDYLARILPAYKHVKIDCIIVVHTPEGTRYFIENGETHASHDDHRYMEVPAAEFLKSLNAASDEDVTAFWLGLH